MFCRNVVFCILFFGETPRVADSSAAGASIIVTVLELVGGAPTDLSIVTVLGLVSPFCSCFLVSYNASCMQGGY